MSYFNKKIFTMRQVVGLLTSVFLGITVIAYAAVNIPYSFTSGNPIRAGEMNDNFTAVKNAIDVLEIKAATLEGKVATLENKVAALEAKDADLVTVGDNSYFTGTTWGGDIETGIGRTARMVINFTDSTYANITIIAYDSETGFSSGIQADYTNCRYSVGTISYGAMPGTISLGCNLGVLANVRINRPSNNLIRGSAFIGNSTLNTNHPKLAHGNFEFSKW